MLLDIQKLISYYMLGVINYSACGGIAGREFYSKAILTHYLYSSPSLKKNAGGGYRGKKTITTFLIS